MTFEDAVRTCHVRSAIRQKSWPHVWHWKNHPVSLFDRVDALQQCMDDGEEYDPREQPECSAFEETPA